MNSQPEDIVPTPPPDDDLEPFVPSPYPPDDDAPPGEGDEYPDVPGDV